MFSDFIRGRPIAFLQDTCVYVKRVHFMSYVILSGVNSCMDGTYIYIYIYIHVITNLISSQCVFAFAERPCTVSGVRFSRVSGSGRVREVSSETRGSGAAGVAAGWSGKSLVKPDGPVRDN